MKKIRLTAAIFLFIAALNSASFGQNLNTEKIKYNTWSATVSGGSMLFYGDLRQFDFYPLSAANGKKWYKFPKDISERKMGFGLSANKYFSSMFGLQLQLQSGNLAGVRQKLNRYFEANFVEYGVNGLINFGNLFFANKQNHKFSIYGFIGLDFVFFKTIQKTIKTDSIIHSYGYGKFGQKKERTVEFGLPTGLGFKYKLNKKFDVGMEIQLVQVNTDKFDARKVAHSRDDKYGYTAVALTYKFGKNDKSLEWTTLADLKNDDLTPLFNAEANRIDSVRNKLKEIDGKIAQLEKDVNDLKNPAKEADDDGDGVPNNKDLEPNTPKGVFVDANGREIKMPKEISASIEKPQFAVYFAFNSSVIDAKNEEQVAAAAKMLKDNSNLNFTLIGHTDKVGGESFNKGLSEDRARAVKDDLVKNYGIDASRLTIIGKGKMELLSNSADNVNRRVDFIIPK